MSRISRLAGRLKRSREEATPAAPDQGNLRSLVMRGGAYMGMRQLSGIFLSIGGMVMLTRAIGPANYGLYIAALNIFAFIQVILQGGVRAYLVRQNEEGEERVYDQATTLMLIFGVAGTALMLAALPLLEGWERMDGFGPVALAMFLNLPVTLLIMVPMARLERNLDYKRVAISEFAGAATYYLVALPLAFEGLGVMAPVVGWWTQQLVTLVFVCRAARYLPRLSWDRKLVGSMIRYGTSFSASNVIFQTRQLVNPLIVGPYLGAEAVGYVALAIRLVARLTFLKETAYRLSIPALARLQQDRPRMVRAVSEGMKLQLLALGPLLVGFGWVAVWLLPFVFGPKWEPAMEIYPFIALSYLINALFNMHSSALYALRRNLKVASFTLTHVILFAGSALLLVPRLGLVGYGAAEIVALTSYVVIHVNFTRVVGSPAYLLAGAWAAAAGLALFVNQLGWWVVIAPAAVALWPRTWRELGGYARAMWKARVA